jgi:hypothetical protein
VQDADDAYDEENDHNYYHFHQNNYYDEKGK